MDRILGGVALPILVKDRTHRFRYIDDAACKLLGRTRDQMIGLTDYDVVPRAQADRFCADDDEVLATGAEIELSEEVTGSDGVTRNLITRKRAPVLRLRTSVDNVM